MNFKYLIFGLLIFTSCNSQYNKRTPYYHFIVSMSEKIHFESYSFAISSNIQSINLDREIIARYNLSIYSVGKEIQNLLFGSDSLSYEDLLSRNLVIKNAERKIVSVPFRSILVQD